MPHYPVYPTQPRSGNLPSMWSDVNRSSDTRYSSGTAPYYAGQIDSAHGRHLAGIGEVQDEGAEQGWALNELRVMAEMDDVQNDGIFDPPGSPPNIYPDSGVFAQARSLPGYLARERMFQPSEVRDVTTGRQIIPVPNSPVAFDTSAQVAFIERGMFPVSPIVSDVSTGLMRGRSTVNIMQNPQAISGFGDATAAPVPAAPSPWMKLLATGVAVGAAGGILYALTRKRRK